MSNPWAGERASVRTYRHGLGDCHLVTLRSDQGAPFRILIDCGVILGTKGAAALMAKVMADVGAESNNKIDLLVATHEHWDHISGFAQAKDEFDKLTVDSVWMAWTEDSSDVMTKSLTPDRESALAALRKAAVRMRMDGAGSDTQLDELLGFFGATGGVTTKDALEIVRNTKGAAVSYHNPGEAPFDVPGCRSRIFVLGPPRDISSLKRSLPSKSPGQTETYSLAATNFAASVEAALDDPADGCPFSVSHRIPLPQAKTMPFFRSNYWGNAAWRRIDSAWLADADAFALALDSLTNNTSLVLAIDVEDIGVLLFAADAQVGNWESWASCTWQLGGKTVTGDDLVGETVLYKVGHHGSYNATLQDHGLKLMKKLKYAIIPVDHAMALTKRWGNIPLSSLATALEAQVAPDGFVVRTDQAAPANAQPKTLTTEQLYYQVNLFA